MWAPSRNSIDLKISVNRNGLLNTLKGNLEEHEKIFNEAREKYQKTLIQFLESLLDSAKSGGHHGKGSHSINDMLYKAPEKPYDCSDEYKRIIGMLELSDSEAVTLSAQDYKHFVMDEWDWKENFLDNAVSAGYKPKS